MGWDGWKTRRGQPPLAATAALWRAGGGQRGEPPACLVCRAPVVTSASAPQSCSPARTTPPGGPAAAAPAHPRWSPHPPACMCRPRPPVADTPSFRRIAQRIHCTRPLYKWITRKGGSTQAHLKKARFCTSCTLFYCHKEGAAGTCCRLCHGALCSKHDCCAVLRALASN